MIDHAASTPGLAQRYTATTLVGRALRLPLALIPRSAVLRVLGGPNKGLRWRAGAFVHGCWLGTYEADKAARVAAAVRPGMTVFDVGANAGYYTLLFSRLVGPSGAVVAFEPLPENAASLLEHVTWNGLGNVRLLSAAVAQGPGLTGFQVAASNAMGHLAGEAALLQVSTVGLDDLIARGLVPRPDLVKMDIEGAEGQALAGATALLAERRTIWFIALHGREARQACGQRLRAAGYAITSLAGEAIPDLSTWAGDEIVARPS